MRYLLPGLEFSYEKWGGVGTALGFAGGLSWVLWNWIFY
jgi:hypothetical protein